MVDMLPQPSDGFEWVQAAGGPALICRALAPFAGHLFTTRVWRLGSTAPEDRDTAWAEVAAAAGVDGDRLVRVRQVHGASVFLAGAAERPEADIILGRDPATALAIQTADCVPLLIADRRTGACAAVHAGWRGMAARAPQQAVSALERQFGSRPPELVAAIGPSVGACCYEVGENVHDAFAAAGFTPADMSQWFLDGPQPSPRNPSMPGISAARPRHWYLDGWTAVRDQLREVGCSAGQIHRAGLCTASHDGIFCSYRREGRTAGRLAAVIRPLAVGD
jgi:polyphenol oxidase